MKASRFCIITPDAIGPVTNGGIGTHCTNLARLLAGIEGAHVALLYTGPIERKSQGHWIEYYREEYGVEFTALESVPDAFGVEVHAATWALGRSRKVYEWLKAREFDTLFFQDWQANAFIPLQARRCGLAFSKTLITCTIHSPTQWQRQGNRDFPRSRSDMVMEFMERYVIEHTDKLLSPSRYMLEWAESERWIGAPDREILPYPFFSPRAAPEPKEFDRRTLIFFGRLETRKGLEVFLAALRRMAPELRETGSRLSIHFLGKIGQTRMGSGGVAIAAAMEPLADVCDWELHTEFSQPEALDFLVEHREALVVAPSLMDNLPFAIIECVELGFSVAAAATGGIPEIFADEAALFEPTPEALASALRASIRDGFTPGIAAYSSEKSNAKWVEFAQSAVATPRPAPDANPKITVCIPHYNYGHFLPRLIDSLLAQTYGNFEVVAVDDGSTDEESRKVFRQLGKMHAERGWRFVMRKNVGVGDTRNHAASLATGEYLVFADPDNVASPDMLEVMAKAITASGVDCLACHFVAFATDRELEEGKFLYTYLPAGPCLEEGFNSNIFGDANFIIRKTTFDSLDGFREVSGVTNEDWEFLVRLCLAGHRFDIIPEFLFHYRDHGSSRTSRTHRYSNLQYVMENYASELPDWANRYILNSIGVAEVINDPAMREKTERMKKRIERLKSEKTKLKQQVAALQKRRSLSGRLRRLLGIVS